MTENRLSIEELRQVWDYNPDTGVFTWKIRPTRNSRVYAGDEAGRVAHTGQKEHRYLAYKKCEYYAASVAWAFIHNEWPTKRFFFKDGNSLNLRSDNFRPARDIVEEKFDHTTEEGRAGYHKIYNSRNRRHYRANDLMRSFGLTVEQYDKMHSDQNGVCAICSQPERSIRGGKVKFLAVDHCHYTGEIRGLLCSKCNPMLGYSGDSSDILQKGAAYVERHEKLNAERRAIRDEQNGVCAICKQTESKLRCDTDENTGKPRGFLCKKCEEIVRFSGGEPVKLERMADYIEKHQRLAEAPLPNNVVKLKEAR
jgi:hypothetical protein